MDFLKTSVVVAACVAMVGAAVAADQPVEGRKLVLKRSASGREKAVFLSKDTALIGPTLGGSDDPMLVGATVDLCSDAGMASFTLPASNWRANGPGTVFKFTNKGAPEPPSSVKTALIKGGRTLKVVSKEAGLPLLGAEGQVAVRVTTGTTRNCALFTSDDVQKEAEGKLIAKKSSADALADCSDAALGCASSPSGAFLDPVR
jgi:hypothetical protein